MTEKFETAPAGHKGMALREDKPALSMAGLFFSPRTYALLRWMLCMVFLGSGFIKLLDLKGFAALIGDFGLVPEGFHFPVALFLVLAEMIGGLALMADLRGSLGALTGLLLFFMGILGYGLFMGFDMDCGCFGVSEPQKGFFRGLEGSLHRDALFLTVIVYLFLWRKITSHSPNEIRDILPCLFLERKTNHGH